MAQIWGFVADVQDKPGEGTPRQVFYNIAGRPAGEADVELYFGASGPRSCENTLRGTVARET